MSDQSGPDRRLVWGLLGVSALAVIVAGALVLSRVAVPEWASTFIAMMGAGGMTATTTWLSRRGTPTQAEPAPVTIVDHSTPDTPRPLLGATPVDPPESVRTPAVYPLHKADAVPSPDLTGPVGQD